MTTPPLDFPSDATAAPDDIAYPPRDSRWTFVRPDPSAHRRHDQRLADTTGVVVGPVVASPFRPARPLPLASIEAWAPLDLPAPFPRFLPREHFRSLGWTIPDSMPEMMPTAAGWAEIVADDGPVLGTAKRRPYLVPLTPNAVARPGFAGTGSAFALVPVPAHPSDPRRYPLSRAQPSVITEGFTYPVPGVRAAWWYFSSAAFLRTVEGRSFPYWAALYAAANAARPRARITVVDSIVPAASALFYALPAADRPSAGSRANSKAILNTLRGSTSLADILDRLAAANELSDDQLRARGHTWRVIGGFRSFLARIIVPLMEFFTTSLRPGTAFSVPLDNWLPTDVLEQIPGFVASYEAPTGVVDLPLNTSSTITYSPSFFMETPLTGPAQRNSRATRAIAFRFVIERGSQVALSLTSGDWLYPTLIREDGTVVVAEYNNFASGTRAATLTPGVYFLQAVDWNNQMFAPFAGYPVTARVSQAVWPIPTEVVANLPIGGSATNTLSTASPLAFHRGPTTRAAYFRFTVPGNRARVTITGMNDAHTFLLDSNGAMITNGTQDGGHYGNAAQTSPVLQAGTYFLEVSSFGSPGASPGGITLTATLTNVV